jgi:hypothetical protein
MAIMLADADLPVSGGPLVILGGGDAGREKYQIPAAITARKTKPRTTYMTRFEVSTTRKCGGLLTAGGRLVAGEGLVTCGRALGVSAILSSGTGGGV